MSLTKVTYAMISGSPANVNDYGADPTGVVDSTAAIQAAINAEKSVMFPAGSTYLVNSTITLPSDTTIVMQDANLVANCGANPLFVTDTAATQIRIFGGEITGTASVFLKAIGLTDTPTQESNYARNIYLQDIRVSSSTIGIFLWLHKAARKVFIDSCVALSANGILSDGKGVEVYANKTLLYSGTSAAGTYGVKLLSSGGTSYYNEGWYFTGCEIAVYEYAVYLSDYFVAEFVSCLLQGTSAGYSAFLTTPSTTTHCFNAVIDACVVLNGLITVNTSGIDTRAAIRNCTFINQTGQCVDIMAGTYGVDVTDIKCVDAIVGNAGVVANGGNGNIFINGVSTDATFVNCVQIKSSSVNVQVHNLKHNGSGSVAYLETPTLLKSYPVQSAGDRSNVWKFNASDFAGTYAVGATISTVTTNFAKGETGFIVVKLSCSGMSATPGAQLLEIVRPSDVKIPNGTSWDAAFIYPQFEKGLVSVMIPYACDSDVTNGVVSIKNSAGNSVVIASHSYFGVQKTV
jgi:hypothetical protein